ncbi:MAG: RecX family transcriptional regulator [Novosphingobium sp.]
MNRAKDRGTGPKRAPAPLNRVRLDELALAYVARFSTTRARLEAYLRRKLRERGWDGEGEPPLAALTERLSDAGYIDDAAYARAKRGSLLRRGYGGARVDQALGAAGIDSELRTALRPGAGEERRAALALAKKRRLGPFGMAPPDRARREKQLAAMLRAGHRLDSARELVDAPSVEVAQDWARGEDDEDEEA